VTRDQVIEKIAESTDGIWIRHKENTVEGWSSKKYLMKLVSDAPSGEFPWLTIAGKEYGVIEFPGQDHNPRVLEYLSTVRNISPRWRSQDETSWCSAFVNWCMEKAGYVGTKSALSTSWLSWGKKIDKPVKGCIAIFSRERGGHVGFYIDETPTLSETYIRIFGGNQEHMETDIGAVNLKYYLKSRLLGYRVPK
jgi:TIGR02594 family protein